jgi:hypothetical protein
LEYGKAIYDGTAWNVGSAPNSVSTDAALTGNYSGAGFTCKNLTVNAGKQTTITSGTLEVNGDFTLKSDVNNGTATFIDDGGTLSVTGATNVEQYITSNRNWYFSSPLSSDNSSVFDAAGTNKMYSYAESTKSWTETSDNSTSLADMTGYVSNLGNTGIITFTGGSLNTGAQSVSNLSYTSGDKAGFHLLGNPYPSYLNWTGASRTNVESTMWFRTKNSSGTYVFDTFNGVGTNNNESGAVTANIPPMQAFWIRVTDAGNGSISFGNEDRNHRDISTNNFRAPAAKQSEQKVLRLRVSNGTNSDETILLFNPSAQSSYDSYDAFKMTNNNTEIPELYTKADNNELVINGMSDFQYNTPITIGFRPGKAATFSIKANEFKNFDADTRIWLVDNLEAVETDMTEGAVYSFSSDAVVSESRFSLVFKSISSSTDNKSLIETSPIIIFQNSANQMTINLKTGIHQTAHYDIYSISGQKLMSQQLTSTSTLITMPFSSGVYLMSVNNGGVKVTKKVIIY